MEDIDPGFVKKVQTGDIIVGGWNFGCGSSREHAPLVIKTCGIGCVIAKSFARIFYRNSINIGFPILECAEAAEEIDADDEVEVNFNTGVITNLTTGKTYTCLLYTSHSALSLPASVLPIWRRAWLRERLGSKCRLP